MLVCDAKGTVECSATQSCTSWCVFIGCQPSRLVQDGVHSICSDVGSRAKSPSPHSALVLRQLGVAAPHLQTSVQLCAAMCSFAIFGCARLRATLCELENRYMSTSVQYSCGLAVTIEQARHVDSHGLKPIILAKECGLQEALGGCD